MLSIVNDVLDDTMDDSTQQHFHNQHKFKPTSTRSNVLNRSSTLSAAAAEQQRIAAIYELDLLTSANTLVFDEATQTAAHFLNAPICIFGVMDSDRQHFKAAIGLSRIGLMNELATSRQLPRYESFCTAVVEQRQQSYIEDTSQRPEYQNYRLVNRYGIRSYLGVPVIASTGDCIGTLFVMDLVPRKFTSREIAFLELIARWSMSEFERNRLTDLPHQASESSIDRVHANGSSNHDHTQETEIALVKASLITKMSQELRTPLTSIIGMTSVLMREIYGPLTDKQKEYMDIVHGGSQYMHSLVSEIVELHNLREDICDLDLSQVDIEMLCQQAIASLAGVAQRQDQTIRLSVEPGRRMWLLDKNKVRQLLYHLVSRVIQYSTAGSTIRIHVSRKEEALNLSVWTSHPWLDDSSNHVDAYTSAKHTLQMLAQSHPVASITQVGVSAHGHQATSHSLSIPSSAQAVTTPEENQGHFRQNLGLVLSQKLTALHGGSISLQGSSESGYRYVIMLPRLDSSTTVSQTPS
ncbi:MAG: GAF domain-containing sensor histidine kinase [Cyanobacteria bacterium J06627_8]